LPKKLLRKFLEIQIIEISESMNVKHYKMHFVHIHKDQKHGSVMKSADTVAKVLSRINLGKWTLWIIYISLVAD
jgi:hypothetical protein